LEKKVENRFNLKIIKDATLKCMRHISMSDEARTIINFEFELEAKTKERSSLFLTLNKLILENKFQENSQDWQSYLFKNFTFFSKINDLDIILNEFASESYRRSIKDVLLFALDAEGIGLSALINFENLPEGLKTEYFNKLNSEIFEFRIKNNSRIKYLKNNNLSNLSPWVKNKFIMKMKKKLENKDILSIFERNEGKINIELLYEQETKNSIITKSKEELKKIKNSSKVKAEFSNMDMDERVLWVRDFVKSMFYKESELNKIKQNLLETISTEKFFKLSKF
jgi:hypothetical protein